MTFIVTFGFICLDFVSGIIKAAKQKALNSTRMREGLFRKVALLLCMVLGEGIEVAQTIIDLRFNVPVAGAICGYIIMMEILSITENICEINPDLKPDALRRIMGTDKLGGDAHE